MSDHDWLLPSATKDEQTIRSDWTPVDRPAIDGVSVHEVRAVPTGYGYLTEMFRSEWTPAQAAVGQIFTSTLRPGAVSAWHAHADHHDRLFVAAGLAAIGLFDARAGSPTTGAGAIHRLGDRRPMLLVVPPGVWHGVRNIGHDPLVLINAPSGAYDYEKPDHWRVPADSPDIPLDL